MFHLIRFLLWLAGAIVVTYLVLNYLGYEVNTNYFHESKAKCQELLQQCKENLIHQGIDNAKCDYQCIDPKLIIRKK